MFRGSTARQLQSRFVTVAVMVKVHDGIVLATDSATTFQLADGSAQVYNNADKIFNLHRGLPIAAMTWGLGSVGPASISTVAKDLRRRFMGLEPEYEVDWKLDDDAYTVEKVAEYTSDLFHEGLAEVNENLVADGEDELPDNCREYSSPVTLPTPTSGSVATLARWQG